MRAAPSSKTAEVLDTASNGSQEMPELIEYCQTPLAEPVSMTAMPSGLPSSASVMRSSPPASADLMMVITELPLEAVSSSLMADQRHLAAIIQHRRVVDGVDSHRAGGRQAGHLPVADRHQHDAVGEVGRLGGVMIRQGAQDFLIGIHGGAALDGQLAAFLGILHGEAGGAGIGRQRFMHGIGQVGQGWPWPRSGWCPRRCR